MQKSNIRSYRTQMFILEINFISMCFTNLMEMDWWNKKETSSSELCFRSLCSTDCTFLALDRSSEHSALHSLPPYSIIIFQGILFALDWNENWVFSAYWISVVWSSAWTPKLLLIDFNSISWINVKQHAEMQLWKCGLQFLLLLLLFGWVVFCCYCCWFGLVLVATDPSFKFIV